MDILILGAGNIGRKIARNLSEYTVYSVMIADINKQAINHPDIFNTYTSLKHITSDNDIENLIQQNDIIINALPHTENIKIATLASEYDKSYFDLSEDVESTDYIKKLALSKTLSEKNVIFMPQCGLAPGFINILAHSMVQEFDAVVDVKMRVGALPLSPSNAFKYNFTWSVDGLINEYINDGVAIENGKVVSTKGMEGLERIVIDGVEYEAFNTSGGAGSIIETLDGKVANVNYKTLRYPGHCDLMKVLLKDLKLENDRPTLKKILTDAIPYTNNDVVIIYASVSGLIDGKLVERIRSFKIYGDEECTAIQRTTAAGMCVAVDLFYNLELPESGFVRQEDISFDEFVINRFSYLR
jgi:saccharopine dehydrogenase-like NADP-dependent oxidoreductase